MINFILVFNGSINVPTRTRYVLVCSVLLSYGADLVKNEKRLTFLHFFTVGSRNSKA